MQDSEEFLQLGPWNAELIPEPIPLQVPKVVREFLTQGSPFD